jgi:hypothetical protein
MLETARDPLYLSRNRSSELLGMGLQLQPFRGRMGKLWNSRDG